MTDRELLENAAKAAGYTWVRGITDDGGWWHDHPDSARQWNPLTDDGDALRLAVKLGLIVCIMPDVAYTGIYLPAEFPGGKYDVGQHHDDDPYAATRRAIVRAAAEIGKDME